MSLPKTRPQILLLNPPSRQVVIRDYYCSKTSRSNYLYQPVDLQMAAAWLREDFELTFMDAVRDRWTPARTLAEIHARTFDGVVFLAGAVSWEEDRAFLAELKRHVPQPFFGSGDVLREGSRRILEENPAIDGVLFDFTNADVLHLLHRRDEQVRNAVFRRDGRIVEVREPRPRGDQEIAPIPPHELFIHPRYAFPFVRRKPFAVVLSDYGCPYPCTFCIMATLGWKARPVEDVLKELEYLNRLGAHDVFFIDQTFRLRKQENLQLCRAIRQRGLTLRWSCFSRVDCVDEELLVAMRDAGCHTIIFGVESASNDILRKYQKGFTVERVPPVFALCRRLGIETCATFILGFPEDTVATCLETIRFARRLRPSYASFHLAVPRATTGLRQQSIQDGLIDESVVTMDQGGSSFLRGTRHLTARDLRKIRWKAFVSFYLWPPYLLRHLLDRLRFPHQLIEEMREGLSLLRAVLFHRAGSTAGSDG